MGKVYSTPKSIKVPSLSPPYDMGSYSQAIQSFEAELKDWCIKRKPNQEFVGETIRFPVADGHAVYMVASITPLELVHLPIGDAWEFAYVERLTKKDVITQIKREKAFSELFKKK